MRRPSPPGPLSHPLPLRRERGKKPAAGYNLVMLMVLVTVLNIAIAASLPAWSAVIRRDKEEELIFRGLQYAEAIRVFKTRFQRDPVRLEELIEVEPRSIRRLWKDPMTEGGKWNLISALEQPPMQQMPQDGQPPGKDDDGGGDGDDGDSEGPADGEPEEESIFGPKEGEVQVGPFKGVRSRSRKTSFLVFNGKDRYDEWHFTVDLLVGGPMLSKDGRQPPPQMNPQTGIAPMGGMPPQMSARWIGRPLPAFLQAPQGSGLPGDGQDKPGGLDDPDGRSGKP